MSESTLFRHVDHKEELLWSTLRSYSAGLIFRPDALKRLTQSDSPEVVLSKIIEMPADTVNYRPELLRLIAVAFIELRTKADEFCQEQLSPAFSTINHYWEMSIRSRKIRDLDPTFLTFALILIMRIGRRLIAYPLDLAAFALYIFLAFELRFDGVFPAQYFHTQESESKSASMHRSIEGKLIGSTVRPFSHELRA